jgi:hypothetical protein
MGCNIKWKAGNEPDYFWAVTGDTRFFRVGYPEKTGGLS